YGPITPAHPGLQHQPTLPTLIQPNPDRHYYTRAESAGAYAQTQTGPAGHGFDDTAPERTWYSVSPVDGLRLIGLDTCRPVVAVPASFYAEGALDRKQMTFLRNELDRAQDRGELVVVLTHHPSYDLHWKYGSAISTDEFRAALNAYPCVVAHLVGHLHRHRVRDHGGYVEFETASTLDYPQEGRIVEIWKSDADVQLRYWVFSHLPDDDAEDSAAGTELTADPLREMRRFAFELARDHPVLEGV
ncbi:MAG: hypothetical protein GY842_26970, partial [bacterium]|nr:hypothetical protein [bacterium]